MENVTELPENMEKGLTKKQEHFHILRQAGKSIKEASKLAGFHWKYGYEVNKKLERMSLKRPKMVKAAHDAVMDTLKMKPVRCEDGKLSYPTHSNRIEAAKMVYERIEPAKQEEHGNTFNFVQVDLSQYQ